MCKSAKVSLCVSVYNCEKFLPAFLDSALQQSFSDYEIVLADNCSTDCSMDVLLKYQEAFPDRITVYQTETHGGAGKGRNLAFKKSHGDYVYWCDCDDLIHPNALKVLYECASKFNADLVCASAFEAYEKDGDVVKILPFANKRSMRVNNTLAIEHGSFFWLNLIRRDLATRVGPMPEDYIFEDVRYLTKLQSFATNIRFLDFSIYYWYKRGKSTTFTVRKSLCEDSIQADLYALNNSNQKYRTAVEHFVAFRNSCYLDIYWQYFDIFVNWIKEQSEWYYSNRTIVNHDILFNTLRWAEGLASHAMPNIIYVDGFCGQPNQERIAELKEKVFHDGCKLVVLSEKNCDIAGNPYIKRAYDRGDLTLVAGYFALKNIYEQGGVFIHNNIRILNPFGYLKYQNAFFSLIDEKTYSEWIFGAPSKSEVIESILKTYSDKWDKNSEYFPLSERIAIILTAKYAIPFDGNPRLFGDEVSVLSPDLSVVDTRFGSETKKCAFEHDFSAYATENGYVTIPRSALQTMLSKASWVPPQGRSPREIELEQRWAELERSNTYRMMMKIRKIGDGPFGPFLKRIYHGLQKLRGRIRS